MASPLLTLSTTDPKLNVSKDQNFTVNTGTVSVAAKTAYSKLGVGASGDQALVEVITKDSKDIGVNSKISLSEDNPYYVQEVNKTSIKFASGSPLVSQSTNIKFPRPEAKQYAPEKIATFLIFKK